MKSHIVLQRLFELRRVTGKTWAQVAADMNLSVAMLMMVKGGKRNLSAKALYRLEQAEKNAGITPPVEEATESRTEKRSTAQIPGTPSSNEDGFGEEIESAAHQNSPTAVERSSSGHFLTFAERLKWLREEHLHMTLRAFAASVGASKTYLYNLETGKREKPSPKILEAICSKHHVRMDWLQNGFGLPQAISAKFVGGGKFPLSGPDAPLAVLSEGGEATALMRIMISQMDNRELVEKSYDVLIADDFTPEEKVSVTRLYVGALHERLERRAPVIEPDLADIALAKEEAAADKALADEARSAKAQEADLQAQLDRHLSQEEAYDLLLAEVKKLASDPLSGVKVTYDDGAITKVEFPDSYDFRGAELGHPQAKSDAA